MFKKFFGLFFGILILFGTVVVFMICYLVVDASVVKAADAFPGGRVPCEVEKDPEFNSDRPYQASPCGDAPKALFCGNTVIINLGGVSCNYDSSHPESCTFTKGNGKGGNELTKHIVVDLSDVNLPILGNTQQIKNGVNSDSSIDDATRLNEYLSSYLNGTNNQAEYGPTDLAKVVDFSGPVQKLLPQMIQESQRIATIASVSATTTYTPDSEATNDNPQPTTEPQNHNQIVACGQKQFSIPLWITDFFHLPSVGLGNEIPVECYPSSGSGASGDVYRIEDWKGETKFAWTVDQIAKYIPNLLPPNLIGDFLNQALVERWALKIPPLPWADKDNKPFKTTEAYQKAYSEWRGNLCAYITLPIVGKHLVCVPFSWIAGNDHADLFPYIPLGNTTDKKGSEVIQFVHTEAPRAELLTSDYVINKSPALYLAHTQETSDLSTLLKSLSKPKEGTNSEVKYDSTENNSSTDLSQCKVLNARSNPGDDATFTNPKSFIDVDVTYSIGQIQCTEPKEVCKKDKITGEIHCKTEADCSSDVYSSIPSVSKIRNVEETWRDTTAGADSIFRKIYPKVEAGAPVSCIGDGPGVSKATYTLNSDSSSGLSIKGVEEPGGGGGNSGSGDAQLYFPHLGSIYDYFLKGVQTALRPQGYGEPVVNGICGNNLVCGDLPTTLPKATGSCNLGSVSSRVGDIPQSLKDIISAASQTYKVPPNLILGVMYGEGLFNPGRLNWSDSNVKSWATCQPVPGCSASGDDHFMGFNGNDWTVVSRGIKADLLKLDPNRKNPNVCNLLDAVYGVAWNLHDSADGGGPLTGKSCFGINLSAPVPSSCDWNNNQFESAIKIAENGYDQGCFTLPGSCATGGGNAALCPGGGDTCEHVGGSGNTSHNACVFDVAHGK